MKALARSYLLWPKLNKQLEDMVKYVRSYILSVGEGGSSRCSSLSMDLAK